MSQWAIVFIPEEDDYVWKVSSEKVPHMTLLFFGEQSDPALANRLAAFLEHTASVSMTKFGLGVDRRGELGPDQADVVFFEKEWADKVLLIRNLLLQNDDINAAYLSTEQYPEWTPHLTLGYPEKPAKPDTRDYPGIHWVHFDRVALWTSDFGGFVFPLKSYGGEAVSYSDKAKQFIADAGLSRTPGEQMLEHFGIKGMRWGVRRSIGKGGRVTKDAPAPADAEVAAAREKAAASPHAKKSNDKLKAEIDLLRGPESLSNTDLKALNNRLQMEQTYTELMDKRKARAPKTKGEKFIEGLKAAGTVASSAVAFANSPAGKLVINALASNGSKPASAAKPAPGSVNVGTVKLKPYGAPSPSPASKALIIVPKK